MCVGSGMLDERCRGLEHDMYFCDSALFCGRHTDFEKEKVASLSAGPLGGLDDRSDLFLTGKNRRQKGGLDGGSFTVEAALILSILLFMILSVLSCLFYVQERNWYYASAVEAAYQGGPSGPARAKGKGGSGPDAVKRRAEDRAEASLFPGHKPLLSVLYGSEIIAVSYRGRLEGLAWNGFPDWEVCGRIECVRPAAALQERWAEEAE